MYTSWESSESLYDRVLSFEENVPQNLAKTNNKNIFW